MNESLPRPPSIEALKDQARRLSAKLGSDDEPFTHSKSLELLTHQYGYKDWNTLRAAAGNGPPSCPAALGTKVRGQYLGQTFEGELIGVQALTPPDLVSCHVALR